ncbi:hypothetical protein OTT_0976 [Orientia tsutsugamushi str. Ikeda]|uniref:SPOR domain-containing protein n=1 Tax=Orientia tsutsugamushi (strain Ikeda) TaxID=334380 RepID=B3CST7_ORITI|nr:SPOR domain-containing protein [Orientia tsutsugamushi]BAG40434.1 hypothetical protein OTT_0976 [Orientia tsutsugamushi str. Ikeda]
MLIKRFISYLAINNKVTYGQYFAYVILMLLILLIELLCLYYVVFYYLSVDIPIIENDNLPHKIKPKVVGGVKILNSDKTIYDKIKNDGTSANNQVKILPLPEQPLKIRKNDDGIVKKESQESNSITDSCAYSQQDLEIITLEQFDNRLKYLLLHSPAKKRTTQKYRLYLDSSYNADLAEAAWQQIFESNSKILKGYNYIIDAMVVDNDKVIYNILAGEFSNFSSAFALCKKLISNQQNCLVVQ